jgi:hypothetical protein
MIDVKNKRCAEMNCNKRPTFNIPTETIPIYCFEHKKQNMINVKNKKCQYAKCKETPIFGIINKRPQYCIKHKQPNMINLVLENKCSILECDNEYNHITNTIKYCNAHVPETHTMIIKRLCKYCDIMENTDYVCNDCKKIQNKKEWAIVRYLRKTIDTPFIYNSSKMLQGCSTKRPDVYFELEKHCVIVEIDEHQHRTYEDSCECARINEIVNGIGGKSVIIIRYNPDLIRHNGKQLNISHTKRIKYLIKNIKHELTKEYTKFIVKLVQLYYDNNTMDNIYKSRKIERITNIVCV